MIIEQKMGNLNTYKTNAKTIDWLSLQWYEANKRIQIKTTNTGQQVSLKFLQANPFFTQGDIIFEDNNTIIAVEILPCHCIAIAPLNQLEAVGIAYEIGNMHLPLFFENECLLTPFEMPLFQLLNLRGYAVQQQWQQLLHPLKTTVPTHAVLGGNQISNTINSRSISS